MAHRAFWSSPDSVTFQDRISTLLDWVRECDATHTDCQPKRSKCYSPPARMIAVGSSNSQSGIHLVPGSIDDPYIALSHCWGKAEMHSKTTLEKLVKYQHSIDFEALPLSFQDAITITRGLGIRFLWIDSLCIVQDDKSDWEREAAKMSSIFRHAFLTITAAAAWDSHGGCGITPMEAASQFDFPDMAFANEPGEKLPKQLFIRHPHLPRPREQFVKSLIHQRGWILQEIVLSRRVAHFTSNQMIWQCHTVLESEDEILYNREPAKTDIMRYPLHNFQKVSGPKW